MREEKIFVISDGQKHYGRGVSFNKEDYIRIRAIYFNYKNLNQEIIKLESRRINLPEIISEGMACILLGAYRTNNKNFSCHSSFDCVDKNGVSYQIKAVSTLSKSDFGGPTSFGPKSEWNELILMHFICDEDIIEIYHFNENIQNIYVNKTQTFSDQCAEGRRPRFSLLKKCHEMNIKPSIVFSFREDKIIDKNI